jgi:hypothetical protein
MRESSPAIWRTSLNSLLRRKVFPGRYRSLSHIHLSLPLCNHSTVNPRLAQSRENATKAKALVGILTNEMTGWRGTPTGLPKPGFPVLLQLCRLQATPSWHTMPTSEELHAKERRKYPTTRLRARVICSHDILTLLCLDRPVSEQAVRSNRDECRVVQRTALQKLPSIMTSGKRK